MCSTSGWSAQLAQSIAATGLEARRLRHQFKLHARWWLRQHTAYQPLFVLATYRSGSNLLIDYLNQLPGVWCYGEALAPQLAIGPRRADLPPAAALGHLRRSLQAVKSPVRGCKLMLEQLADCKLSAGEIAAAFPGAKFIVLYRESLAEQYLSGRSAHATKQWLVPRGQVARRARVTVDPAELTRFCEWMRRSYSAVVSDPVVARHGTLLSYEELTSDPQRCLTERIGPLLGILSIEPQTRLTKQNPQSLAERVENYAEVAELLTSPACRQRHAWLPAASTRAA
jgi:LPS sulfotransferase NodH